jgi:hypothetical protein
VIDSASERSFVKPERASMMREERRTFERVEAGFPALIVAEDNTGGWRQVAAVVVDISPGGLRLCAEDSFVVGEVVQVAFPLPDDLGQTETSLEILASEPTAAGEFTLRGKFANVPSDTVLRIARWTLAESRRVVR